MRARSWWIAVGFVLWFAPYGCGDSPEESESGGAELDAGAGGAGADASGIARTEDAGVDAGDRPIDAGTDAGNAERDAGPAEAGASDGGMAGPVDPGEPRDAANVFLSGHSGFNLVMPAMLDQI